MVVSSFIKYSAISNRHTSQSTLDINRSSNNPLEFKNIKKLINSNFFLLFVIFLFLISNNLINASSVMPSYATFGLFWLILSLINIHIRKKIS